LPILFVAADNIEDPMDLGRSSGIIGARWHNWQCEESEEKSDCSHDYHRFLGTSKNIPLMV
jgi:hypothetical protein